LLEEDGGWSACVSGVTAAHECYSETQGGHSRKGDPDHEAAKRVTLGYGRGKCREQERGLGLVLGDPASFRVPFEILSDPDGLTEEQLAEALAIVEAERAAGVEVYALDRALLTATTAASGAYGTPQSSDGRGIDHATLNLEQFDPLVGHLIGIYLSVSS
jgi:hypothetical protein